MYSHIFSITNASPNKSHAEHSVYLRHDVSQPSLNRIDYAHKDWYYIDYVAYTFYFSLLWAKLF